METFAIVLVVVAILLIISGLAYGAWWWLSSTRRLQNIRRRSLSAMELMEKATVVYNQSDVLNNIVARSQLPTHLQVEFPQEVQLETELVHFQDLNCRTWKGSVTSKRQSKSDRLILTWIASGQSSFKEIRSIFEKEVALMGKVEKTLCFEQLVAYAISPTTHQLALVLPFRELTLSSPNDILAIAMGLAGAIKALHDMGIAYNRLTPNNVLISEVPEAILSIVECPSPIAQQGFQSGRYFPTIAGFGAAHCFHETTGLLHIPKQCFSFEIQKPADPIRAYYGEKNLSSSFGELDFQDDETGPKLNGIVSSALDPRYISHDIIALIMRQMDSTVQEKNVLGFSEIALPSSDQHRWQQSDLISFGIVLREMLTRQAPYSNVDSVKKVIEHQMAELSVDLTYGDPTPNIAGFESEQCHRLRLRLWDVGQQCFKAKSNLFIHQIEDYLLQLVHQFEES